MFITEMGTQHLVACVTDTHCRIGLWRGRQLQDALCVGLDLAGDAQLKAWLAPYAGLVLFILCDVLDERYQLEHLPQVGAGTRRQLLQRKCAAWPALVGKLSIHGLGQRRSTRIEEAYLLAGIASESPLAAWMERLQLAQWRVRGVYLQALLLPGLLPASLTLATPHGLCLQLSAGRLRLSYLQQGVLCFSRQVTHGGADGLARWLAREVAQTQAYLQAQQWLTDPEALVVYMLVAASADPQANVDHARALAAETSIAMTVLPPISPAPAKGDPLPADVYASMQLLLTAYPQLPDLAAPALTGRDQRVRIRHMLAMASIGIWLMGSLCCWQAYQRYLQASGRAHALHQQQVALAERLPADPISGTRYQQLQSVLSFVQPLSSAQRSPAQIWRILEVVIPPASAWRVSALQWTDGPSPTATQPGRVTDQEAAAQDGAVEVCMTLRAHPSVPATRRHADWQMLMAGLRQQAAIDHIQVLSAPSSAGTAPSGQALSAPSRTIYTLRFSLQPDSTGSGRS